MNNDHCTFCLNHWGCNGECTICNIKECEYNRNGHCLDIKALKHPEKQTGCIYYSNRNNGECEDKIMR